MTVNTSKELLKEVESRLNDTLGLITGLVLHDLNDADSFKIVMYREQLEMMLDHNGALR